MDGLCANVRLEGVDNSRLLMSYLGEICPTCSLEMKVSVFQEIPPETVSALKTMNPNLPSQVMEMTDSLDMIQVVGVACL